MCAVRRRAAFAALAASHDGCASVVATLAADAATARGTDLLRAGRVHRSCLDHCRGQRRRRMWGADSVGAVKLRVVLARQLGARLGV